MRDALKNYLSLASGLTEVGRQRAIAASKALVSQGEATAEQVSSLAEDLLQTSRNNRAMVTSLVRAEVERAVSRLGPVTAEELGKLTKRLQTVESALREATTMAVGSVSTGARAVASRAGRPARPRPAPARKSAATMAVAKQPAAAAKKPAAKKPAARKPAKKPAKKRS